MAEKRTISLGLAKVEYGEVAASGMQTELTQLGYTYEDSFEQTTEDVELTELKVEEVDYAVEVDGKLGKITYEWDMLDPKVSEMAATGGGTADTENNEWASPDAWEPNEKAFVFTPKKGFIHKIPRANLTAYPKGGFKKGNPQLWHMKATVMKQAGAAPRILKRLEAEAVATPTFSPASWASGTTLSVTLSCATNGATIHYTTDGSNPTTSSPTYSSAISLSATTTIKAIAIKSGMNNSEVASKTYTKP